MQMLIAQLYAWEQLQKRLRRVCLLVVFLVSYSPLATNILQTLGKQQH